MQKKITETTATNGIGISPGKKLFKVPSGEYAGRVMALIQTTNSDIKFTYADKPYSSWYSLTTVASDAANFPFDAVMDANGNVHVVYCEQTTNYLVAVKLTFSGGSWSVGSKVYIYNGGVTSAPSVTIEANGKLWVSWSRLVSGYYDIQVKSSTDSGATWGSGSSDIGDTLKTGLSAGVSKIIMSLNDIFVVYTGNGSDIFIRSQPISGGSWTTEYIIASGTNMDEHFDTAISSDGLLGIVFDSDQLRYREYDGSNWSSITVLDSNEGLYPQVIFVNNVPVVIYLSALSSDQILIKYTHRNTGTFSTPTVLDNKAQQFDSVALYDSSSGNYADLTSAASSATASDIFHPDSSVLIKNSGDIIYLGMEQKFRYQKIILSIAGAGGTVSYSYYDGSNWKGFTPSSGIFNLDAADKDLLFWDDFLNAPQDWQKNIVNGVNRFWVKIEVVSDFSMAPIGSQITAISDVQVINIRR